MNDSDKAQYILCVLTCYISHTQSCSFTAGGYHKQVRKLSRA